MCQTSSSFSVGQALIDELSPTERHTSMHTHLMAATKSDILRHKHERMFNMIFIRRERGNCTVRQPSVWRPGVAAIAASERDYITGRKLLLISPQVSGPRNATVSPKRSQQLFGPSALPLFCRP